MFIVWFPADTTNTYNNKDTEEEDEEESDEFPWLPSRKLPEEFKDNQYLPQGFFFGLLLSFGNIDKLMCCNNFECINKKFIYHKIKAVVVESKSIVKGFNKGNCVKTSHDFKLKEVNWREERHFEFHQPCFLAF